MRIVSKEEVRIYFERRQLCRGCPTRCDAPPIRNLAASCPLPEPRWKAVAQGGVGLGDIVEAFAKPIASALKLDCLDENKQLKPESGCAQRKARLNKFRIGGRRA